MRALPFVLAAFVAVGCAPTRDRSIRLERLAAQRRNLDLTFEQLEARLTATQARVRFWEEIKDRHESVSAISCTSQDEHAQEMAKHVLPEPSTLHRARVASVGPARAPVRAPAAASAPSGGAVHARVGN
jgi:hypothetical protein